MLPRGKFILFKTIGQGNAGVTNEVMSAEMSMCEKFFSSGIDCQKKADSSVVKVVFCCLVSYTPAAVPVPYQTACFLLL